MRTSMDDGDSPISRLARRHRWLPFVLPFLVYMMIGLFEPQPETRENKGQRAPGTVAAESELEAGGSGWSIPYRQYPVFYLVRFLLSVAVLIPFLPTLFQFTPRVTLFAVACGVAGGLLWIGLCRLDLETMIASWWGVEDWLAAGNRVGFDPFTTLEHSPSYQVLFLGVRFLGLVLLVPVIEEFFLRGFVMRFVLEADWWSIPIGQPRASAIIAGTCYGILTHPTEALAAAVWFSLVTLLACKTRNIWDAIAAHATTNLLLGLYVVLWKDWSLW